jgi:hypothetical protein
MDTSIEIDSNVFIRADERIYGSDEAYQGYLPALDVAEEISSFSVQNYSQKILEVGYIENNSHLFPSSVIDDFELSENSMDIDMPYDGRYQTSMISSNNDYSLETDIASFLNTVFGKHYHSA